MVILYFHLFFYFDGGTLSLSSNKQLWQTPFAISRGQWPENRETDDFQWLKLHTKGCEAHLE
jgi:hypothetical protein